MDLISLLSENSNSNKTILSADTESNQNERDKRNELAVCYNQVIRIKNTKDKKPLTRYKAQLDSNCFCGQLHGSPPPVRNTKKLVINDYHDNKRVHMISKKLMMRNKDDSIFLVKTQSDDCDHVTCSKNIPEVEIEPKVAFGKCNNNIKATNTHQSISTHQILIPKHAEKETYCCPVLETKSAETKTEFVKPTNKHQSINTNQTIAPKCAEKTTYCRPVLDMYNQEFIHKTMERNARLQNLVRRLVIAREREKEKVARKNYVNELKNSYGYNYSEPRTIPNYEYTPDDMNPNFINYYNTRYAWDQSNPYQNLLEDFYRDSNEMDPDNYKHYQRPFRMPYNYADNRYCFPPSPQGQFTRINRERPKYQLPHLSHDRSENRFFRRNKIIVDKDKYTNYQPASKTHQSNKLLDFKKHNVNNSLSVKTDFDTLKNTVSNEQSREESIKDKYIKVSSNVEKLKQKIMQSEKEVKFGSLASIENKLDVLIESMNTFIDQVKSKRMSDTKCEVSCQLSAASTTKTNEFGLMRKEQIFCGMVQEEPRSTLVFNDENYHNAINKILNEEASKSDRVKRDIEEILNTSCVQLKFDIPTKERSTEITDSLFKTRISKGVVVEEIDGGDTRQMTIAVNTDPLGLLALFRVSAETVKQILSYMPHIDYHSYLSRLQFPQTGRVGASHYICNICGAAFGRPSQLSDHIQQHNLGNSRDCCVCRHVLDMQRHRSGLFPCRHCGQQFTRAYCRQLHEQSCGHANRLSSDSPSLMLLR